MLFWIYKPVVVLTIPPQPWFAPNVNLVTACIINTIKGTVSGILSDPLWQRWQCSIHNCTLKALSDQILIWPQCLNFWKQIIFNCDFSTKLSCVFSLQENICIYPKSIPKVSQKYPESIPKVFQKYPKSIPIDLLAIKGGGSARVWNKYKMNNWIKFWKKI